MAYSDAPMVAPCEGLSAEASAADLYQAGLAYAAGLGVEADVIEAHKWFNLAALKGNDDAKVSRKEMADLMTSADLKRAQKAARDWLRLMN